MGAENVNVLEVVREQIENQRLLGDRPAEATVVVGVSGGPDSLCLLHVLQRLGRAYGWSLHVAHLNHRLRGDEADDDMVFVALRAIEWELPCTIEVTDVAAVAERRRLSLEEAARQLRYRFLADVARRVGATAVAVGHQADDQTETVLMHFLRGTGLAGLRGMLPVVDLDRLTLISIRQAGSTMGSSSPAVRLVRPLLTVPRAEIERYCQVHGLSPRFDRSNLDTTLFRNRLRHELLPTLETYNPNIRALLRRTAAVAAADYALITRIRDEAWEQQVREETDRTISWDLQGWRALPLALRRATLRHAAFRLRPGLRDLGFVHIQQAVDVATHGSTGAQATLPQGLRLEVDYRTLRLAEEEKDALPTPDWPLLWSREPIPVAVPGETALPDSEWRLEVTAWHDRELALSNPDRWTAYLDADHLGSEPRLRRRRPGDRFQPLGMAGQTAKVADWMVNAKIPCQWRGVIPLLVHGLAVQEEIAWLVGWRIDERVKITKETKRMMRFRFTKP